jgi:hypothetical protein
MTGATPQAYTGQAGLRGRGQAPPLPKPEACRCLTPRGGAGPAKAARPRRVSVPQTMRDFRPARDAPQEERGRRDFRSAPTSLQLRCDKAVPYPKVVECRGKVARSCPKPSAAGVGGKGAAVVERGAGWLRDGAPRSKVGSSQAGGGSGPAERNGAGRVGSRLERHRPVALRRDSRDNGRGSAPGAIAFPCQLR